MKKIAIALCTIFLTTQCLMAASVSLKGVVKNSAGNGILGVTVTLAQEKSFSVTTDAQGAFTVSGQTGVSFLPLSHKTNFGFVISANKLIISALSKNTNGKVEIFSSNGRKVQSLTFTANNAGTKTLNLPGFGSGLHILRVTIGNETITRTLICLDNSNWYAGNVPVNTNDLGNATLARQAATAVDTIIASKTGYTSRKLAIDSYEKNDIDIVLLEESSQQKNIIVSDGFEGNNLDSAGYAKLYNPRAYGIMSISTNAARTGSYSLTSDSNNTGVRKWVTDKAGEFVSLSDSIAGLEFYCMAKSSGKTNFFAAIVTMGTSAGMLGNGFSTVLGMGIGQSDSLWYTYQRYSNPKADSNIVFKSFAPLEFNKWYKCNLEYDFAGQTITYYLDGTIVYTRSAVDIKVLDMFIAMRDELGEQGKKDYFIDDVSIYKK